MALALAILLVAHGLIHLLGFARAFALADLPQLTEPISPIQGGLWLTATCLFVAAATTLFVWPRGWWAVGAGAIIVSTAVIVPAWSDAKFGMLANLIVLASVAVGFVVQGPVGLRAKFEDDVDQALARTAPAAVITDADLAHLPDPVRRYLRISGAVGRERVRNFHVRMHGRIRSGPDARWLPFTAEQYSFVDPPARLFYLSGSMFMVPVHGFHRYVGSSVTMRARAAGLVPLVDMSGVEMSRSETVMMFNDMSVMAPATLIDPAIVWGPVDAETVRARVTNAGQTIRAVLSFRDTGELANFWSDDRYQASPDGATMERIRWSTPLGSYRPYGAARLASAGEARWYESGGDYTYLEMTIDEVHYNVRSRTSRERR